MSVAYSDPGSSWLAEPAASRLASAWLAGCAAWTLLVTFAYAVAWSTLARRDASRRSAHSGRATSGRATSGASEPTSMLDWTVARLSQARVAKQRLLVRVQLLILAVMLVLLVWADSPLVLYGVGCWPSERLGVIWWPALLNIPGVTLLPLTLRPVDTQNIRVGVLLFWAIGYTFSAFQVLSIALDIRVPVGEARHVGVQSDPLWLGFHVFTGCALLVGSNLDCLVLGWRHGPGGVSRMVREEEPRWPERTPRGARDDPR